MPNLYMLVGVPASGKSTWLKNKNIVGVRCDPEANSMIISTDDYIEENARRQNKTYNEVFNMSISWANEMADRDLEFAIENDLDIYWDQTNLNAKTRKKKLARVPSSYKKIAVVFPIPNREEWLRRLDSRPDKTIPRSIIVGMLRSFEMPTTAEGFDVCKVV